MGVSFSVNESAGAEIVDTISGSGSEDALGAELTGGVDCPAVEGVDVSQEQVRVTSVFNARVREESCIGLVFLTLDRWHYRLRRQRYGFGRAAR